VLSRSRRLVTMTAALAMALGLAACGDGATQDSAGGTSTAGSDASFPRTITHDKGETTLERKPERIVALDLSLVGAVVSLERPLVGGIATYRDLTGFPPYFGDAVADTVEVGPLESPNLEKIVELEPDLIISATVRHDELYDELSGIAPTVFVKTTGPTWKDNIRLVGEALGEEDKAEEVLTAYETRAAALGKAINEKDANPAISVVRFVDGPTRLYAKGSFSGIILADMGLARPEAQNVDEFTVEISEEQIRMADGDHIFVAAYSGGTATKEAFLRNPLWGQLAGVQAGNVHEVDDAIWMTSVNLHGANLIMDDMAKIFGIEE
jgi:iron complex transport system substrate-binding protein